MSSVDSKRNKMQLLADCILFLLVERGRMPDSLENRRFSRLHCGLNCRFFWRALRSRLNSNQTKLNAD